MQIEPTASGSAVSSVLFAFVRTTSGSLFTEKARIDDTPSRDITRTRPERRVRRGLVQAPGGHGVFPSLSVAENLRLAAWTVTEDRTDAIAAAKGCSADGAQSGR